MQKPATSATNLGATKADAARIKQIGNMRGMRLYRVISLLLAGWDMLTEDQQYEAHKRLFTADRPASREPVSAA